MENIDFMSALHKKTTRDYLARVNDPEYPKHRAASLAKRWGFDYWDGDRRVCYGGYKYIAGRWLPVAKSIVDHYRLKSGDKILDIGCGKGYQLVEFGNINPNFELVGLDISSYAIEDSHPDITNNLMLGCASKLPFADDYFDFAFSITTLHNLYCNDLYEALREVERVAKRKYLCVESYRNEEEKANLLYWQVTCEAFHTPEEWLWWFNLAGYSGDYSFIYFN